MLLNVEHVSKAFGDQTVLADVSLQIHAGQRLGLVGANGAGKTTLLKIVTGELAPDGGRVQLAQRADLRYLAQTLGEDRAHLTMQGLIDSALGELRALETQMRALEAQMAAADELAASLRPDELDACLAAYGPVAEQFEHRGGYDLPHRMAWVLAGLRVDHIDPTRDLATLSGGEKSRVGLAALLLRQPDLLLLDEPTNHLDFAALTWLEEYLQSFAGGVLVVSHDRDFLNRAVNSIVEIQEYDRTSRHYAGDYDFYAATRAQEREKWAVDYADQQAEIWELRKAIKGKARQVAHNRPPRDNDKYIGPFKDGRIQGVIARNVRAAEEKLRRIEDDPIPRPPRELQFNSEFDPAALVNQTPLSATQLTKRFGTLSVLQEVDVSVYPQSRVAIVGPNGCGKSTLLKLLAGQIAPDAGEVARAVSVRLGYLDQEQEGLDPDLTVMASFRAGRSGDLEEFKAELLGMGLFIYPELAKRVGELSVGQKRKLQIAQLVTGRANLLLLDEPTNHISLDVLESFENALLAFPGPVVAVSHDRRFIRRFAQEIWAFTETGLHRYLGGWEEYAEKIRGTEMQTSTADLSRV
ncbi:MAG: ABC-F family ATP-binding cassette domain-containing protein [Litorilinea sp.]